MLYNRTLDMSVDSHSLVWFVLGGFLVLTELIFPGFVTIFFGLSAILVSFLVSVGFIGSVQLEVGLWVASSAMLISIARSTGLRLGAGRREKTSTNEELDAFGELVTVVEVATSTVEGRIRFRGSTWPARTVGEPLEPGMVARVVARDNLVWIIEKDEDQL